MENKIESVSSFRLSKVIESIFIEGSKEPKDISFKDLIEVISEKFETDYLESDNTVSSILFMHLMPKISNPQFFSLERRQYLFRKIESLIRENYKLKAIEFGGQDSLKMEIDNIGTFKHNRDSLIGI